jgi:hypothetical protein
MQTPQGRKNIKYAFARKVLNPILKNLGYTLITDHFYQPIPNIEELTLYKNKERPLHSIQWNIEQQVELARDLLQKYASEFNNKDIIGRFGYTEEQSGVISGDAEFLYSIIRDKKSQKIIEIGSGGSTLVMAAALRMNFLEDKIKAQLISVEPYPGQFLKDLGATCNDFMEYVLLENKVQTTDISIFESLEKNDILFVDSSHVFKQGSDVEFEFLEIYPVLKKGVLIHIHDIFFPFDYPIEWNLKESRYWNEQYFLETFLQFNSKFEILASLSMVANQENSTFLNAIDIYHEDRLPGSFWMAVKAE